MLKHTPGPWSEVKPIASCYGAFGIKEIHEAIKAKSEDGQNWQDEQAANAHLIAAAPDLLEALSGLLDDIEVLIEESSGVYGLHLNGDPSPWSELLENGRFERLSNVSAGRAAIAKARGVA